MYTQVIDYDNQRLLSLSILQFIDKLKDSS